MVLLISLNKASLLKNNWCKFIFWQIYVSYFNEYLNYMNNSLIVVKWLQGKTTDMITKAPKVVCCVFSSFLKIKLYSSIVKWLLDTIKLLRLAPAFVQRSYFRKHIVAHGLLLLIVVVVKMPRRLRKWCNHPYLHVSLYRISYLKVLDFFCHVLVKEAGETSRDPLSFTPL